MAKIVNAATASRIENATVPEIEQAIIDIKDAINLNSNSQAIIDRLTELELVPQNYDLCDTTQPDELPTW